jgi:RNA polymerase sigma factor (sigma-70 family)
LKAALDKLTAKQKQVINLYFWQGYNQSEIAEIMKCKQNTVSEILKRAKSTLAKHLKK